VTILSWLLDNFPGFFATGRYGVNWHFAMYLGKLWTDFDEIFWTDGGWPNLLDFGGDPVQYPNPGFLDPDRAWDPGNLYGILYLLLRFL